MNLLHVVMHSIRIVLILVVLFAVPLTTRAAESDEYALFIGGFSAFQGQDYRGAATKMSQFLKDYPSTPLRDMALFWLARAEYRLGDREQAANHMAQFLKENPDTPLRSAIEPDLLALAGSSHPVASAAVPVPVAQAPGAAAPAVKQVRSDMPERALADSPVPQSAGKAQPDMKARAVAEYRTVMEKFPGSPAAVTAARRLKEVTGSAPQVVGSVPTSGASTQVVTLEVGQYAAAEFAVSVSGEGADAGAVRSIPFQVVNRGNGPDSFVFEAGFPPEFAVRFAGLSEPAGSLTETPVLAPGEQFSGSVLVSVPPTVIDGQRGVYPLRLISKLDRDVSVSREIPLAFSAPLLRMVAKPDKATVLPGEAVSYHLALLNLGSATARNVSYSVAFPPQYEPIEPLPRGFRRTGSASLASDELSIVSGGRHEQTIVFRLKEEALAGQELFCRLDLRNHTLNIAETFLSPVALVGQVSGVAVRSSSEQRSVLPGERVVIPISIINTGNVRERFLVKTTGPAALRHVLYRTTGSGGGQTDEPIAGNVGVLSPREEASLKLELVAPSRESGLSDSSIQVVFEPERGGVAPAAVNVRLNVVRPVVTLEMQASRARLKPGEIAHLVINVVNSGSSMAKDVTVLCGMPEHLDLVAADPVSTLVQEGSRSWKISQLGPGERRSIVLTYRIQPTVAAGTNLLIENKVTYRDQLGSTY